MAEFVQHEPCPSCGSGDANARYSDGSAYCFKCHAVEKATDGTVGYGSSADFARKPPSFLTGSFRPIRSRNLTEETCRKFRYEVGVLTNGDTCHIAPYFDAAGSLVAQKVRPPDKSKMFFLGSPKDALLFGQHVNRTHGKRVIVTEGEIDCLSVSQALKHQWAVVSVPTGAAGAAKALAAQLEWLEGFDEVVLLFDMDEAGRSATQECAKLLAPGKARLATLPLKDPSEMLQADRVAELVTAIYEAREFRPDGIRSFRDIAAEAKAPLVVGLPWFDARMTAITYGRRWGEIVLLGAGTGVGKTDFIMEQAVYDVMTVGEKVGLFFFEQPNGETGKRFAGKLASKAFHIPDGSWEQSELDATVDRVADMDMVFVNDHFGRSEWETVKSRIRYLVKAQGIRIFYIDNLSCLTDPANERECLETLIWDASALAQELKAWFLIVSHLNTPKGKPHEEGGAVSLVHLKGARAIVQAAHFVFGIERNTKAQDPKEKRVSVVTCIKDRNTGRADGERWPFRFDAASCRLKELQEFEGFTTNGSDDEWESI